GSDFGGVNILVSPIRPRHLRGVVLDSAGRPANASISSIPGSLNAGKGIAAIDGAFDLLVVPGSYVLIANSPEGTGYRTVQVENADVDNVTITTLPSFNVPGRLTVETKTGSKRDAGQLRVSLLRDIGLASGL